VRKRYEDIKVTLQFVNGTPHFFIFGVVVHTVIQDHKRRIPKLRLLLLSPFLPHFEK
jgi:hypothetical protein